MRVSVHVLFVCLFWGYYFGGFVLKRRVGDEVGVGVCVFVRVCEGVCVCVLRLCSTNTQYTPTLSVFSG